MAPHIPVRPLEKALGVRASWKGQLRRADPEKAHERWAFEIKRSGEILLSDEHVEEFIGSFRARPVEIRRFARANGLTMQLWIETYVPMGSADVGDLIPLPLIRFAAGAGLPINSQFWPIADPLPPPSLCDTGASR